MDSWHDPQETLRVLFCVLAALQGATGSGPGDETATLEAKKVRYKYLVCLYHEHVICVYGTGRRGRATREHVFGPPRV